MKKTAILLSIIFTVFSLYSYIKANNKEITKSQETERAEFNNETTDNSFLVTNNSVGFFTIGDSWQKTAKDKYQYKYVQGIGFCVDACCKGGFDLGTDIIEDENGKEIETVAITIGASDFEESESFDDETESKKYENNPNVFYVSSDNCKGWYWTDSISYIIVCSDLFRTKEGIGVGSTLEEMQKVAGKFEINIGWIEEDINAIQLKISSYPNINFILDADDYKDGWEELSKIAGNENSLTIADFKKDTKIRRLIVE